MAAPDPKLNKVIEDPTTTPSKIAGSWLQIEREKSQLVAALNSIPLGIMLTDDHGNIVTQSAGVEKILGPSGVSGALWSLPKLQEKILGDFNIAEECTKAISQKAQIPPQDIAFGTKTLRIFIDPINLMKESLAPIGAIIIIEDVTAQKQAKQLQDEFFAVASHELKTPLSAIRANAEMILHAYGNILQDEKLKSMITTIRQDTIRLIDIVHDFLDASRLEEQKVQFRQEAIYLPPIVKEVIGQLQSLADFKKIYLKLEPFEDSLPQVIADQERVKQVLINLIANAIKFTQNGGVNIKLEKQEPYMKISVSDTGVGIPEYRKNMLFEKFIEKDENSKEASSGIGLYICKMLINHMGGKIFLEDTKVGIGSTFVFTIPLAKPNTGSVIVRF